MPIPLNLSTSMAPISESFKFGTQANLELMKTYVTKLLQQQQLSQQQWQFLSQRSADIYKFQKQLEEARKARRQATMMGGIQSGVGLAGSLGAAGILAGALSNLPSLPQIGGTVYSGSLGGGSMGAPGAGLGSFQSLPIY